MTDLTKTLPALSAAIAILAVSSVAHAEPLAAAAPPALSLTADPLGETVDLDTLADLSGGDGVEVVVDIDQVLTGVSGGNTITTGQLGSGAVQIGANAFEGFDGIGNFIVNTGHQNVLQSAMNVTIILVPPTE
jgi:hypothetical protein